MIKDVNVGQKIRYFSNYYLVDGNVIEGGFEGVVVEDGKDSVEVAVTKVIHYPYLNSGTVIELDKVEDFCVRCEII